MGWSDIPKLWSRLETLRLKHTTGLTMAVVGEIIPQLESLKKLRLPEDILEGEHHSFIHEVIGKIANNRPSPIEMRFEVYDPVRAMPCRVSPRPEKKEEPVAMDVDQNETGLVPVPDEEDSFSIIMDSSDDEFDDI